MMTAVVREVEQVVANLCMLWPGVLGSGRYSAGNGDGKTPSQTWEMRWTLAIQPWAGHLVTTGVWQDSPTSMTYMWTGAGQSPG